MKHLLLAGLVLTACTCASGFDITQPISNAPDLVSFLRNPRGCYTPCGVHVTEGDCESIQRYEGRVLARLAPVGGWDAGTICEDLSGWELKVRRHDPVADSLCEDGSWQIDKADGCATDGGTCCVSGLTQIAAKRITVETTRWDYSSFAHEVVHVADGVRAGHCPWVNPKLKLALYELEHSIDSTEPASSCTAER
jgi:hypothetical protein